MDIFEEQEFLKALEEEQKKIEKRVRFTEYGKLGGRPKMEKVKRKKFTVFLSEGEHDKLIEISQNNKMKAQDYIRYLINHSREPDPERNRILVEFRTNFKRISNHFRSGVWDAGEKKIFGEMLKEVIMNITKALK